MSDFRSSWLWRHAFVNPQPDISVAEQQFFRDRFLDMRDKASMLVSRIAADYPELTVHDLTHLDALWETASLVAEGALTVSPAEAFVFGAAVLLHDSAMSLAAYPRGLEDLKETVTWKDAIAALARDSAHPIVVDNPPHEITARALPAVLRRLHAEQAAALAEQGWVTADGDTVYLIDDSELRRFYGSAIGEIAHSHWWPVSRIEQELQHDLGAFSLRTKSRIDRVKLACLLRIADALHLDARRAPRFLRTLIRPQGISAVHWTFQERLAAPHIDVDGVIFTNGSAFTLEDADAWWLAYDTMSAVDRELRDVDLLLQNRGRGLLRARRVQGAGTPESLAQTITTKGWRPVDAQLRVSDIPKIVETLGGAKLYGDDPTVVLRELIQNAADAVQARVRRSHPKYRGNITVALAKRADGYWLSVEDNGIGMSERVLTGPLIDFGNSFWGSSLVTEEFPGLIAAGMQAIGRYGIGFFSVFMLGSIVRVISRRNDWGEETARTLEFRDGTASRPILCPADRSETPPEGGTRVEIKLKVDPRASGGILPRRRYSKEMFTLQQLVAAMAPNVDVAIEVDDEGVQSDAVGAGDWLRLADAELLNRLDPPSDQEAGQSGRLAVRSFMQTIEDDAGRVFGRAFIKPASNSYSRDGGWVTVGGLRASRLRNIQGVLVGRVLTAARDSAAPTVPSEVLATWATAQAGLIAEASMDDELKARSAEVVLECGGDIGHLPIASWGGEWLNAEELRGRAQSVNELAVSFEGGFSYEEDYDSVHPREFREAFRVGADVVVVPKHDGSALALGRAHWPNMITGRQKWNDSNLAAEMRRILTDAWGGVISHRTEEREIGMVHNAPISRSVSLFTRTPPDGHDLRTWNDTDEILF